MANALMLILLISASLVLFVLAIYWFELDEKFLKAFEPTFRKMSRWFKEQNNPHG